MKQITEDLYEDIDIILNRVLNLHNAQAYWSNETEIVMDELKHILKRMDDENI